MPEPIYPVARRQDGVREIPLLERRRLLSPTEREDARRKREEARRKVEGRSDERPRTTSPQDRQGGVDYSA